MSQTLIPLDPRHLETSLHNPRTHKDGTPNDHANTAEDLQPDIPPILSADNGTADGTTNEGTDTLHRKRRADPRANLTNVADLRDQRRREGDEAS